MSHERQRTVGPEAPPDLACADHVGARDLADWRTRAGRWAVDRLIDLAGLIARITHWSAAHLALVITVLLGGGIVLALNAAAAEVYENVTEGGDLARLDQPVLDTSVALRTPSSEQWATTFTDLGGKVIMPVIAVGLTLVAVWLWRRPTPIWLMLIATAGSVLTTVTGKELTGRARPPESLAVPPFESSASFPSGHTLNATVVLGIGAYLLVVGLSSRRARMLVIVLAGMLAIAMGLSRVYLGHHWLTDVMAGWLLGLAWVATVITGHRVWVTIRRREEVGGDPSVSPTPAGREAP